MSGSWGDSPWLELKIALSLFATIVAWAALSSWLGDGLSTTAMLLGIISVMTVRWRRHLTPEVLSLLALYGVPAAVVALWCT